MFKRKSHPVHPRDQEVFGRYPTFFAILIAAGFITDWPHAWTSTGIRSRRDNSDDRGRYDGDAVLREAHWWLKRKGDEGVVWKWTEGKPTVRIGRLSADAQDKEEGDIT